MKMILTIILLVGVLYLVPHAVRADTGRLNLQGLIKLDTGQATKDLDIELTVRAHGFVVVPPTFIIIRPILGMRSITVAIPKGEAQAAYTIEDISQEAVDYSVRIRCLECTDTIRTQFFSASGNTFGLDNDNYIDPENLLSPFNLEAVTQGEIRGQISLLNLGTSLRTLKVRVALVSLQNPNSNGAFQNLVIQPGVSVVDFRFSGYERKDDFVVSAKCMNCRGGVTTFPDPLSGASNHSQISLSLDARPVVLENLLQLLSD